MEFELFTVPPECPVREALARMTQNKRGILFVCASSYKLLGVLTDGDLRRAMSQRISLEAPVNQISNLDPIKARDVEEAKSIMNARSLIGVPVVNKHGILEKILISDINEYITLEAKPDVFESEELKNAIAIIPARGGSKRIPNKNLAKIGNKPLVQLAIECAQKCNRVGKIIVSTDSEAIADVARSLGVDVPWLRPAHLAGDKASSLDVVLHALEWAKSNGINYPYGLLLEPTAPLRRVNHLYDCLQILETEPCDSVVSISEVPHVFNPEEQFYIDNHQLYNYVTRGDLNNRKMRNEQNPSYVPNGLVYGININSVMVNKNMYGKIARPLITEWETFLDIDTHIDLEWARFRLGNS